MTIKRYTLAAIAALTRGAAEAESGRIATLLGAREPVALLWPAPPAATPVPGLAAAARAALDAAAQSPGLRHQALVALAIGAVWSAELLNTAVEALTDLVSPEYHALAGKAKDVAAGAVLVVAAGALVVGLLVFGPPLWALWGK